MRLVRIPFFAIRNLLVKPIRSARICAAVLSCCTFTSCGLGDNSCVTFVWNPGGIDSPSNPSCPFTQGNGTVNVSIATSFTASAGPASPNLEHVYVTLAGIDARPNGDGDITSPEWQEMAPELESHPVQLDLIERDANGCAPHSIAKSEIPGGVYTAIRLRLANNGAASGDESVESPPVEQDACGGVGLNCVVTMRGEIRPLTIDGGESDLIIEQKQLDGTYIRILPDQANDLTIKFNPYSSMAVPVGNSVKIIPQFTASIENTCEPKSAEEMQSSSN